MDDFRLSGTFGIDFTSDDAVAFRPYRWNVDSFSGSTPDGNRTVRANRSRTISTEVKGSWIFNTDRFESTLLFGGQGFLSQSQSTGGGGRDFPGPGLETLSALGSESSTEFWARNTQIGGYIQDQLGFNDWAFLTVGGRWMPTPPSAPTSVPPSTRRLPSRSCRCRDSTCRWGPSPPSGSAPQSASRVCSPAPLTSSPPLPRREPRSVPGCGLQSGQRCAQPEVSTEWEIGAEMGFMEDTWSLDATYWNRTGTDVMVARQFPVTGGFTATQLDNIGGMEAYGIEVSVRGSVVQSEGFSLNIFANTAYEQQEITDLGGAPPLKTGGSYPRYRNYLVEGFTPAAFFGAKIADVPIPLNILTPVNGECVVPTREQALAYFSQARDPSEFKPLAIGNSGFGTADYMENTGIASNNCGSGLLDTYLGKPTPDFAGSTGFTMAFAGNFELSTLFEYKFGHQAQDLSGMFRRANAVIGRNTPRSAELGAILRNPASSAEQRLDAAIAWAMEVEGLAPMSGMNGIYDADWIQLRELSLTYRVPTSAVEGLGLSTATLNLGARNLKLFMLGDYPGMDPEGNVLGRCNGGLNCNFLDSTEGWGIPVPRRITLSTRVTF